MMKKLKGIKKGMHRHPVTTGILFGLMLYVGLGLAGIVPLVSQGAPVLTGPVTGTVTELQTANGNYTVNGPYVQFYENGHQYTCQIMIGAITPVLWPNGTQKITEVGRVVTPTGWKEERIAPYNVQLCIFSTATTAEVFPDEYGQGININQGDVTVKAIQTVQSQVASTQVEETHNWAGTLPSINFNSGNWRSEALNYAIQGNIKLNLQVDPTQITVPASFVSDDNSTAYVVKNTYASIGLTTANDAGQNGPIAAGATTLFGYGISGTAAPTATTPGPATPQGTVHDTQDGFNVAGYVQSEAHSAGLATDYGNGFNIVAAAAGVQNAGGYTSGLTVGQNVPIYVSGTPTAINYSALGYDLQNNTGMNVDAMIPTLVNPQSSLYSTNYKYLESHVTVKDFSDLSTNDFWTGLITGKWLVPSSSQSEDYSMQEHSSTLESAIGVTNYMQTYNLTTNLIIKTDYNGIPINTASSDPNSPLYVPNLGSPNLRNPDQTWDVSPIKQTTGAASSYTKNPVNVLPGLGDALGQLLTLLIIILIVVGVGIAIYLYAKYKLK